MLFLSTITAALFSLSQVVKAVPAPVSLTDRATSNLTRNDLKFSFYNLPGFLSGPCDLCTSPDGKYLWGQDQLAPYLFRIDPASGEVKTFLIPFTVAPRSNAGLPSVLSQLAGRTALSCAIRPGQDGNIYSAFGTRNQLVKINPNTFKITVYTPDTPLQPLGDLQPFNDLYSGPDGIYFTQTTANIVSFFSFNQNKITKNYIIPTPLSAPLGMFYCTYDNKAYFTELLGNKIGRIDPKTGKIEEFPVPASLFGPAVIRVQAEGKYIYFTSFLANALGRMNIYTGEMATFRNPSPGGFAAEDTIDSKGNVWFSSTTQNLLSKFDPNAGAVTEQVIMPGTTVAVPISSPLYFVIAMNYGPGNALWFTEETVGRVGRYSLS